jgi:hypothetical protein
MRRISLVILNTFILSACSLDPYELRGSSQIANIGPRNSVFLKSLRCEMITFMVENRLRAFIWEQRLPRVRQLLANKNPDYTMEIEYLSQFPYIDLDATQYSSIQADLKNIDTAAASLGVDWKYVARSNSNFDSYGFGLSYNDTRTFQTVEPIALPQYADFGPLKSFDPRDGSAPPKAIKYTTLYAAQPDEDAAFYCYKSFYRIKSATVEEARADVHHLLTNDGVYADLINFQRIFVDNVPMAEWLMNKSVEMASGYQTIHTTYETVIPGQLQYGFTLELKPSADFGYTGVSNVINPITAGLSLGTQHTSNFIIFFNTPYSQAALQAKLGNTCVGRKVGDKCRVDKYNFDPSRLNFRDASHDLDSARRR